MWDGSVIDTIYYDIVLLCLCFCVRLFDIHAICRCQLCACFIRLFHKTWNCLMCDLSHFRYQRIDCSMRAGIRKRLTTTTLQVRHILCIHTCLLLWWVIVTCTVMLDLCEWHTTLCYEQLYDKLCFFIRGVMLLVFSHLGCRLCVKSTNVTHNS